VKVAANQLLSNGSVFFVGTATVILRYAGMTIMTDPNFLHKGDHVHLGFGLHSERLTDPAIPFEQLPQIDFIVLSHLHEDHFDKLVEERLQKGIPIITNDYSHKRLAAKGFIHTIGLNTWESVVVTKGATKLMITSMPGRHAPTGLHLLHALPDVMGCILEFGVNDEFTRDSDVLSAAAMQPSLSAAGSGEPRTDSELAARGKREATPEQAAVAQQAPVISPRYGGAPVALKTFTPAFRMYISGDTLMYDELKDIPKRFPNIDVALLHLGGTQILGIYVTMDSKQGIELTKVIDADVTIPIHYNDYTVFKSPLSDFQKLVEQEGLRDRVVYLSHGETYNFDVRRRLLEITTPKVSDSATLPSSFGGMNLSESLPPQQPEWSATGGGANTQYIAATHKHPELPGELSGFTHTHSHSEPHSHSHTHSHAPYALTFKQSSALQQPAVIGEVTRVQGTATLTTSSTTTTTPGTAQPPVNPYGLDNRSTFH